MTLVCLFVGQNHMKSEFAPEKSKTIKNSKILELKIIKLELNLAW